MFWTKTTPQIFLGILLGAIAVGTTPDKAAALTPLDLIKIPLNAVGSGTPKPLPNRNIDVFKENLNGNNLNVCVSPCGVPNAVPRTLPSRPTPPPQVRGPIAPQGSVSPSQTAQSQTAAPQRSSGPVLSVPPIKLF